MKQACNLYREVAGNVEAGDESPSDFLIDARRVRDTAANGSDQAVMSAAESLAMVAEALASSNPDTAPTGPDLAALTDAQQQLLRTCSAAGH